MRSHKAAGRPGALVCCARWLGFDHNPLRRGTDRIEGVLRLVMMILIIAVPVAAVVAGQQADHLALRRAHAEQAADHQVTAVLLENAPATGIPDPYSSTETAWVPARWQLPGKPARSGEVLAPVGTAKGSTVRIWVDASGAVASPPMDRRTINGYVCIAVVATLLVSALILTVTYALVRRALDRGRMRAWEAEWRTTGPLWTGHRS